MRRPTASVSMRSWRRSGEGVHKFFAEAWDVVEDFAKFAGGDAKEAGGAAGNAGDERRTLGEEVDVAGESAGVVGGDDAVVIRGVLDFNVSGFDDEEVEGCLSGAENRGVVGEVDGGAERAERFDFFGGKGGEGEGLDVGGHVAPVG